MEIPKGEIQEMSNYVIKEVHISTIKWGDTVEHNGVIKTVGNRDIKQDGFFGHTLFGDSYRLGRINVKKVEYVCNQD